MKPFFATYRNKLTGEAMFMSFSADNKPLAVDHAAHSSNELPGGRPAWDTMTVKMDRSLNPAVMGHFVPSKDALF